MQSFKRKITAWTLFILSFFLEALLFTHAAFAQTHKGISFQGVIKLPSGEYPNRAGMTVNARILSPNGCVLREEEFSGVNITNGYLNLAIGTGVVGGYDPALSLTKVMDNSSVASSLTCLNSDGSVNGAVTSFNPAITNGARKLRVSLTIDSVPIVADFNMRSMPFAINAETVNGKADTDLINVNNAKSLNQANVESIFERFTKLDALLNNTNGTGTSLGVNISGNSTNITGVLAVANGGTGASSAAAARTNLGLGTLATLNPSGTADGTTYLRGDGTWATVASASTTLTGDLSGTLPSPVVEKIKGQEISATGTTVGQILRYAGSNTWTPSFLSITDLRSPITGTAALPASCGAGQTLTWTAVNDTLTCSTISLTSSQVTGLAASATTDTTNADNITSGTLSASRLPTSISDGLWSASAGNVSRASGNVGIGTTNPTYALDVVGGLRATGASDIGSGAIQYNPTGYASIYPLVSIGLNTPTAFYMNIIDTAGFQIRRQGSVFGPALRLGSAWGTAASPVTSTTNQSLGSIMFEPYTGIVGAANGYTTGASIGAVASANASLTNASAHLTFSTTRSGTISQNEKMRITDNGNIGIGTTTPGASLVVSKTAPTGTISSIGTAVSGTGTNFTTAFSSGDQIVANGQVKTITAVTDATNLTVNTAFSADLAASTAYARVGAVLSAGNVGIGTTAPYGALHINNNNGPDSADDFWMTTYSNTATPGMFAVRARGDQTTPTPILNGDTLFTLSMSGYNGSLNRNAATIKVVATNDFNTSPSADMIFYTNNGGTGATEKMRIMASGNVGIGATSPAAKLDVTDATTTTSAIIVPRAGNFTGTTANGMVRYNTASNLFEFYQNGAWVNYTTVSDGRLKTNVEPVTHGLDIVKQLNPVFYDWDKKNPRTQSFRDKHEVGFIAQEVEKVLPEVVDQGADSYRSVQYGKIVSVVVAAVKELYSKFLDHDEQLANQNRRIASKADQATVDAKVQQLEQENAQLKAKDVEKTKQLDAMKAYLCGKDPAAAICK